MADNDNETPIKLADTSYQESSQVTDIIEEQAAAPATPFEALQIHLQNDPYDTVAWQDFINIAEDSEDPHLIHTAYDSLLKVYPNTVSYADKKLRLALYRLWNEALTLSYCSFPCISMCHLKNPVIRSIS